MKKILFIILVFACSCAFGQEFTITKMPKEGFYFPKDWYFRSGDSLAWAKQENFDKNWQKVNTRLWLDSVKGVFDKIGWFVLPVKVDSTLLNQPFGLQVWQRGAMEIYLNGKKIHQFGRVSADPNIEDKYTPFGEPVSIIFTETKNILAVRYSASNAYELYEKYRRYARTAGFQMEIKPLSNSIQDYNKKNQDNIVFNVSVISVLVSMGLLHLVVFLFYRKQRKSLFYSILSIVLSLRYILDYLAFQEHYRDVVILYNISSFLLTNLVFMFVLLLVYEIFLQKIPRYFLLFPFLSVIVFSTFFISNAYTNLIVPIAGGLALLEALRISITSLRKKNNTWSAGAMLMIGALIMFLLTSSLRIYGLSFLLPIHINTLVDTIGVLSVTVVMSIFLAREIAFTNSQLEVQLVQVQELSAKNLEQERINKHILESQNQILEQQVQARTHEIQEKSAELAVQNEEIITQRDALQEKTHALESAYTHITDSVRYAERIQKALLGNPEDILRLFDDAFIFFRPKNIVSGDFYWLSKLQIPNPNEELDTEYFLKLVIAADCTGHGVPGAFMTVMGNNFLNDIIYTQGIIRPDQILYSLDQKIRGVFRTHNQNSEMHIQDGMDMAIVLVDENAGQVHYAGAKNPLFLARENNITEVKASRFPIGSEQYRIQKVFEPHLIEVQEGDVLYIFSDGFTDQFGGKSRRRYMKRRFRSFLEDISHLPMSQQKRFLEEELEEWSPSYLNQQTDDILVIGIRINLIESLPEMKVGFRLKQDEEE